MAVAFDASSPSGTAVNTAVASYSWTHTPVGTPRGVAVFAFQAGPAGDVDHTVGVTYGGVAMTFVGSAADTANELGRCEGYHLGAAIPTGAQTVTVTRTNNTTEMWAVAATLTADADTATAGLVTQSENAALAEVAVDDGSPGSDSVRVAGAYWGGGSPPGTGASSTLMRNLDFGAYGASTVRETTAGQGARNVGFSAVADDRATVHFAVKELLAVVVEAVIHQAIYRGIER